jgi:hypothetical protein
MNRWYLPVALTRDRYFIAMTVQLLHRVYSDPLTDSGYQVVTVEAF